MLVVQSVVIVTVMLVIMLEGSTVKAGPLVHCWCSVLTCQSYPSHIVESLSWFPWRRWSLSHVVLLGWSLLRGVLRVKWRDS
jgi:hypothetical protein